MSSQLAIRGDAGGELSLEEALNRRVEESKKKKKKS
jgi:hypothetical protein